MEREAARAGLGRGSRKICPEHHRVARGSHRGLVAGRGERRFVVRGGKFGHPGGRVNAAGTLQPATPRGGQHGVVKARINGG